MGVFVAATFIGLLIGLILAIKARPSAELITLPTTAPTVIEYRTEAQAVLEPFLLQIKSIPADTLSPETATAIADLATLTQDRLLRMRVPGDEREAHLSLVVILDQWKIAVRGSETDLLGVIERTTKLVEKYRWVIPTDSDL